ncbi:MAG: PDZ domain-containing protein, partial [Salinibacterium sp.]
PTKGALEMLTVSIQGNPQQLPSWFDVSSAYLDPQQSVVPVEALYPPGVSVKEENRQGKIEMANSQKEAIAAALHHLKYHFDSSVSIAEVPKGGPAEGVLRPGDTLLTINGDAVTDVTTLRALIAANGTDKAALVRIERDGTKISLRIVPVMSDTMKPTPIFGVVASNNYDFPFSVKFNLDGVGGPSAGMMFAVGITDELTPGSLSGGERVAGTGTIDSAGAVGAIGGIRQKMFGARNAGAHWFLAPRSNCDEVTGHIPIGLHVFAVRTLDDSLTALAKIKSGDTSSLPTCPAG